MNEIDGVMVDAVQTMFDLFGKPIVYTPFGEAAKGCFGIFAAGEALDDSQWKAALQESGTLRVMKSDIPTWSQKDTAEIDGRTWQVVKKLGETPGDWRLAIRTDLQPNFQGR